MPIGMALDNGRTDDGLVMRRLSAHGADVPGKWVIVDGEFIELGEAAG